MPKPTGLLTVADITRDALKILEQELTPKYRERIHLQTKDGEMYEFCDYVDGWVLFKRDGSDNALKSGMTEDEMFATLKLLRK